eukprot:CAMPEP_0172380134 /NCGR_PEP_ID=MMETSP1060-20121228/70284_1 /TAXON_ID=37318 /ORGANISM="Pseudo-nitzschia pungens, Strain cf. cingulata" /LENGTH=572 /DNA_ID=CAMNT_0013107883 /DNA_START=127 /DNA_END=1846 /DNA_ORIENTATION=-
MEETLNLNLRRQDQSKRRRSKSGPLSKRATRASLAVCCVLQFFALLLSIDFSDIGVNGFVRVAQNRIGIFREAVHRTDEKEDFFSRFRSTDGPVLQQQHQPLHSNTCHNPNSRSRSRARPILWMGKKGGSKGDKQNRKPKKRAAESTAASGGSGSSSSSSSIPVQRVSNQINVPIRRQIRYGKINKQLREAAATGQNFRQTRKGNFVPAVPGNSAVKKRTSYRKQLDEDTIQQKALERQRKGQNPDWSVVLNQTKANPLILVDGYYNVIYKWARLKKHMVRGDTEHARELLSEDLEGLASLRRWRIECVFDGAGRGAVAGPLGSGPGNKNHNALGKNPTTTPFGKAGTVRTVFTGSGIEADTYIEGRCVAAKNVTLGKITSSLIVATDDAQIKLVANSAGALCMGSDRFVLELKAVKKSMQYRVEKAMAEVNGVPIRPEKLWGTSVGGGSGGGSFYEASTVSEPAQAKKTNTTGTATAATTTTTTSSDSSPSATEALTSLRAISAQNRIGTAKKEVVEEHADGSKIIKARYGANEIMITDKRNKKPRVKKYMGGADLEGKKKKKKKKKNKRK